MSFLQNQELKGDKTKKKNNQKHPNITKQPK